MVEKGQRDSILSSTPHSRAPSSRPPRPLSSLLPFTAQHDLSSPSTIRPSSTSKLGRLSLDPLSNFRADAARPPAITATMSSEDDMQGIEDITESQWQACPPGRSSDGPSSSSAPKEEQGSEDDHTRWDGGSGSSVRKRRNWEMEQAEPVHRELSITRSPSTSPVLIRGKKSTPNISRTPPLANYDEYDAEMVDDRSPMGSESGRKLRESSSGIVYMSDEEYDHSIIGNRRGRREEEEEEAAESGCESTHIPTSPTTRLVDTDDEDALVWDPSPPSPRSLARRNRSLSTSSHPRKSRKSSPSPIPDRDTGGPGPSSTRSRSTTRKAAQHARARNTKFVVHSDHEDEDYNPYTGGDDEAFTREYERQAEKERDEPEETDGSDQDIDGKDGEEDEGGQGESGDEDGDDFLMMPSQRPPQPKPASAAKSRASASNQAGPSRNHGIFQSAPKASIKPAAPPPPNDDEYDDLPADFFDDVDLEALDNNKPTSTSNPIPARNLSNLFSPPPPKRSTPSSSTSRVPLSNLPFGNMPPPAPRTSTKKSSVLSRLDDELDYNHAPEPQIRRVIREVEEDDDDDELGYMPVSKMPAKWQDFFMNHWRRGADKSKAIGKSVDEEDEPAPSKTKTARGSKATKGSTTASGSTRGGRRGVTKTTVRRQEVDEDEEEDDYEGDLGGPQAPTVTYKRAWVGRGRGGFKGRGGGRKRGTARKR